MQSVSAYIPCFNNAATLAECIASLAAQTVPLTEIVVIDDGSTDETDSVAQRLGARVVSLGTNKGRGAARRRGMEECGSRYVLSVDGNKALPADFIERALTWFADDRVAAVCGRLTLPKARTVVERWCARHIYRVDQACEVLHHSSLITSGALCRKDLFMQAGNFDASYPLAEDREISGRLLDLGADIIFDPQLVVTVLGQHDLDSALERFWRWNAGESRMSVRDYLRYISYSIKVMAAKDMACGDFAGAAVSLLSPHHLYWRSRAHG